MRWRIAIASASVGLVLMSLAAAAASGRFSQLAYRVYNFVASTKCIILAVDNSGSVSQVELASEVQWITAMVEQLDATNYRGHVGLIVYNCEVERVLDPLPYFPGTTSKVILPMLSGIRTTNRLTAHHRAIQEACNLIAAVPGTLQGGLVLATDGLPTAIDCSARDPVGGENAATQAAAWFQSSCSLLVPVIISPDPDVIEYWGGVVPWIPSLPAFPISFACGDWSVTLSWNSHPEDLDLHLWVSDGQHVYFERQTGEGARLDRDDKDGYGPENLRFSVRGRETYVLAVHHYEGSGVMSASGATVTVGVGETGTLVTFHSPPCSTGTGDLWLLGFVGADEEGCYMIPVDSCISGFDARSPAPPADPRIPSKQPPRLGDTK